MRSLICAGLALLIVGGVVVYWGARQYNSRRSPVAALASRPRAKTPASQPAQPAPAASAPENVARVTTWSSTDFPATRQRELAPEAAYGAPVVLDPPEVIQIEEMDPSVAAAISHYLKNSRPRLETEPDRPEDQGPASVVVNVLERPTLITGAADETKSGARMPRCSPDQGTHRWRMPYADESLASDWHGAPAGAGECNSPPATHRLDGEEEQSAPQPRQQTDHTPNWPFPLFGGDRELDLESWGIRPEKRGERAFSYFIF